MCVRLNRVNTVSFFCLIIVFFALTYYLAVWLRFAFRVYLVRSCRLKTKIMVFICRINVWLRDLQDKELPLVGLNSEPTSTFRQRDRYRTSSNWWTRTLNKKSSVKMLGPEVGFGLEFSIRIQSVIRNFSSNPIPNPQIFNQFWSFLSHFWGKCQKYQDCREYQDDRDCHKY